MREKWFQKKACLLAMLFLTALFVGGCGKQKKAYHGYYVYGLDANETKVVYAHYQPKKKDTKGLIEEFINQLSKDPKKISMKKAVPDDVRIERYVLSENEELTLYFNAAYSNLKHIPEILRRAAVVKTLCQIKGVKYVRFYVAGQPLMNSMSAVGFMTANSFVDNTGGETTYKQNAVLTMYYANSKGTKLHEVPVEITYDATIPLEQLAMEQLVKGPYSIAGVSKKMIQGTVPKKTKINKITIKENTCYIDLSKDFLKKLSTVSAQVAIYSVVDTLTELSTVNKVQFSIDGQSVAMYGDIMKFNGVFERDLDLVENPS